MIFEKDMTREQKERLTETAHMERDQFQRNQRGESSTFSDNEMSIALTGKTIEQRLKWWARNDRVWGWLTS